MQISTTKSAYFKRRADDFKSEADRIARRLAPLEIQLKQFPNSRDLADRVDRLRREKKKAENEMHRFLSNIR